MIELTVVTDTINDYLLVEKAGRDQVAFLLLYERHREALFGFLYRLSGSVGAAEELTHDCFLSVVRESKTILTPKTASFRIQLYSTARTLFMEYSRNSLREAVVADIPDHSTASTSGQSGADRAETLDTDVRTAVGNLPYPEREVLILSEYEGLDLSEISIIVGIDHKIVLARLERARQRLRDTLMSGSVSRNSLEEIPRKG
jgi:RNA polymerase sigma-70 factor (ECF subfamily)